LRRATLALAVALPLSLAGCIRLNFDLCDQDPPHPDCLDGGADAGVDSGPDLDAAHPDADIDAGPDLDAAQPDADIDAGSDLDAGPDLDAGTDAG